MTNEQHTSCPGHAAYLRSEDVYVDQDGNDLPINRWGELESDEEMSDEEADAIVQSATHVTRWVPEFVCTNPQANGHRDRYANTSDRTKAEDKSPAERDAAKKARAVVIENSKAWKAARKVRNEWIKTYLTRKTPPASAGPFLAVALTRDADIVTDVKGNHVAASWLGADNSSIYGRSAALADIAAKAGDKRPLVITLGIILGGCEARAGDNAWRENGEHSSTGRYLRFLAANGYVLSEVETCATSEDTV